MKNWSEIEKVNHVYLVEDVEMENYEGDLVIIPQYTKCKVAYMEGNELVIVVVNGKFKDEELYFYTNRDKPEELFTEEEYKLINVDEKKVWNELTKIAKLIDKLGESSSENLKHIRSIITKETGK